MFIKYLKILIIIFGIVIDKCKLSNSTELSKESNIIDINYLNGLIAAFGDFNSDKLTDIFIILDGGKKFSIMKQYEQNSKQIFNREWNCKSHEKIYSIIPSDYNGDAMLDIILLTKLNDSDEHYNVKLLFGNGDSINCSEIDHTINKIHSQPLLLDINGDMISDLIIIDENQELKVWLGQENGKFRIENFPIDSNQSIKVDLKSLNSKGANAFIDLNNDHVADIFFNNINGSMQYWLANGKGYTKEIEFGLPNYDYIGSSSFADINADGVIDHIAPVCDKKKCSIIGKMPKKDGWSILLKDVIINGERFIFEDINYDGNEFPVSLRVGDINGDGFVDLISIMRKAKTKLNYYIVLFINKVQAQIDGGNIFKRSFDPLLINETLKYKPKIVSFFDLYEDGKLDIIFSRSSSNRSKSDKDLQITFVKNTQMTEANFLKVLVTSGRCLNKHCYTETILEKGYRVPYGTNKAGSSVSYELIDANGHFLRAVAGQLSQSSHFALQLPYCFFGLGPDSNYVDHVYITFPTGNTTNVYSKDVIQIVPDSQIVVIPHPVDDPSSWVIQLFVTPSEIIYKTLYTFLGIIGVLLIMIAILHRREQLKDAAEAEQYRITWPERRR